MASTAKKAKYQCERCQQIFNRKERMVKHEETSEKHNCTYCDKKHCQLKDLRKHQLTEHNNVNWKKCDRCTKTFASIVNLEIHRENAKQLECTICKKEYCQSKDLQDHQLLEHGVDLKKCGRCLKVFGSIGDLKKHKQNAKQLKCNICEN